MHLTILAGLVAAATATAAQIYDDTDILIFRRDVPAGGQCGTQANGAVCAAGLCCSDAGVCGTGGNFCTAPACQLSAGPACDGNQTPKGADTSTVPRPLFGSVPYGVDISHCSVPGKVAITFDDGPYLYTNALLDILRKNSATATFFVVGNNGAKGMINDPATGYPDTLKRMVADGHQIGSHTWSHQDLSAITAQQRRDQIIKNEIALADVLGVIPTYLRPPYTRWNQDALNDLKTLGYHVLNYDIDTRDWQGDYTAAENIYQTILAQHSPASSSWISLEHDIYNTTVHTFAQYIIDTARTLKYQLVTVGECLGDPPANWYRNAKTGQPASPAVGGVHNFGAQTTTTSTSSSTTSKTAAASLTTTSTSTTSRKPVTTSLGSFPSAIAAGSSSNNNGSGNTTTKSSATATTAAISEPTETRSDSPRLYSQGGSVVMLVLLVLAFIL